MLSLNSFISVWNLVTFFSLLLLNYSASFINKAIWFYFSLFSSFTVFICPINSSFSVLTQWNHEFHLVNWIINVSLLEYKIHKETTILKSACDSWLLITFITGSSSLLHLLHCVPGTILSGSWSLLLNVFFKFANLFTLLIY